MPRPGKLEAGQPADGKQSLADVDDDHAERESPALGAQRIGAAGVAAALRADVHAAQGAEQQAADHRPQQVSDEGLETEFEHVASSPRDAAILASGPARSRSQRGRNTSASMQRTDPPPSVSIVGIGAATMRFTRRGKSLECRRSERGMRGRRQRQHAARIRRAQFEHVARETGHLPGIDDFDVRGPRLRGSTGPARGHAQRWRCGDHAAARADGQHHVGVIDRDARGVGGREHARLVTEFVAQFGQGLRMSARRQAGVCNAPHVIEDDAARALEEPAVQLVLREVEQAVDPASAPGGERRNQFQATFESSVAREHRIQHDGAVGMQAHPVVRKNGVRAHRCRDVGGNRHGDARRTQLQREGIEFRAGTLIRCTGQAGLVTLEAIARLRLRDSSRSLPAAPSARRRRSARARSNGRESARRILPHPRVSASLP